MPNLFRRIAQSFQGGHDTPSTSANTATTATSNNATNQPAQATSRTRGRNALTYPGARSAANSNHLQQATPSPLTAEEIELEHLRHQQNEIAIRFNTTLQRAEYDYGSAVLLQQLEQALTNITTQVSGLEARIANPGGTSSNNDTSMGNQLKEIFAILQIDPTQHIEANQAIYRINTIQKGDDDNLTDMAASRLTDLHNIISQTPEKFLVPQSEQDCIPDECPLACNEISTPLRIVSKGKNKAHIAIYDLPLALAEWIYTGCDPINKLPTPLENIKILSR